MGLSGMIVEDEFLRKLKIPLYYQTENMEFVNITSGHLESVLAYVYTQHLNTRAALVIPKSNSTLFS